MTHPALRVLFPSSDRRDELQDLVAALVDDYEARGIEEGARSWIVYFRSADDRDRARLAMERALGSAGVTAAPLDVPDEDWAARTQSGLSAVRIDGIVVAPPWDIPHNPSLLIVVIQPSMGFGTGHHASTRLCLRLLQQINSSRRTVLDVGTGSGVLAIAAAKLGAAQVTALDCDEDAVRCARANLLLNRIDVPVTIETCDCSAYAGPAVNVVLANLTGRQLRGIVPTVRRLVRPGGRLIGSGFTCDEATEVRAAFADAFAEEAVGVEDGWMALLWRTRQ